jgi:hypothetical protein
MMETDWQSKVFYVILLIGCLLLGLKAFNINLLNMVLPAYAVWVERGIGVLAGYLLYTYFKK